MPGQKPEQRVQLFPQNYNFELHVYGTVFTVNFASSNPLVHSAVEASGPTTWKRAGRSIPERA